ncbi:hypothetical protein ACOME3_009685 [Neoechinorhynchus agilis]
MTSDLLTPIRELLGKTDNLIENESCNNRNVANEDDFRKITLNLSRLNRMIKNIYMEMDSSWSKSLKCELRQYEETLSKLEKKYRVLMIGRFTQRSVQNRNLLLYDVSTNSSDQAQDDYAKSVSVTPESITSNFEEVNLVLSDTVASNVKILARLEYSSDTLTKAGDGQKIDVDQRLTKSRGLLNKQARSYMMQAALFYLLTVFFFLLCAMVVYHRLLMP